MLILIVVLSRVEIYGLGIRESDKYILKTVFIV